MSVEIAVLDRPPPLLFKKFKLFAIAIFINLLTTLLLVLGKLSLFLSTLFALLYTHPIQFQSIYTHYMRYLDP